MSKLYIFGVGGTGARVIKALTMLLASGVKINASEIIPIIIDPDQSNGDVTRTIEILREYQNIHSKMIFDNNAKNHFFETPIASVTNEFRLGLENVENKKFRNFTGYDSLDESNKALLNLLFSKNNLEADMQVGFKGNPNIGSVVLNQFKDSSDYADFAASFSSGDRIFIISSIFGGTGASGFPLLVKNIREPQNNLATTSLLRDAPIGAVTVLPYFGVAQDENSAIDKATFISKTKAALTYYKNNLTGNKSLNALYYIGGAMVKDQKNNEGSMLQKNEAHFIELASALSIIDFMNISDIVTVGGKAVNPVYKEYGLHKEANLITFNDLGHKTNEQITTQLIQYSLFVLYLQNHLTNSGLAQAWANGNLKIDDSFISSSFYSTYLSEFNTHFKQWIDEMQSNSVSFTPINLNIAKKNLFELVVGKKQKTSIFEKGSNYFRIDNHLNKAEQEVSNGSVEQKFMDMFYIATHRVVKEKF